MPRRVFISPATSNRARNRVATGLRRSLCRASPLRSSPATGLYLASLSGACSRTATSRYLTNRARNHVATGLRRLLCRASHFQRSMPHSRDWLLFRQQFSAEHAAVPRLASISPATTFSRGRRRAATRLCRSNHFQSGTKPCFVVLELASAISRQWGTKPCRERPPSL